MRVIAAISRNLSNIDGKDNGIPIGEIIQVFPCADDTEFERKWEELLSYPAHKEIFYFKEILEAETLEDEITSNKLTVSFTTIEKNKLKVRGPIIEKLGKNPTTSTLLKSQKPIELQPFSEVK